VGACSSGFYRSYRYLACPMKKPIEVYLFFYRTYRMFGFGVIRSFYRAIKKVIL
jgi:hypothetical protein